MINSRIEKEALVKRVVRRTGNCPLTVENIVDATLEEINQSLKRGERVSPRNFGACYVRPERESWVFQFNPARRLRKLFGRSSKYKRDLWPTR